MITERKLRSLPPATRLRKIASMLLECELELRSGSPLRQERLLLALRLLVEDEQVGDAVLRERIAAAVCALPAKRIVEPSAGSGSNRSPSGVERLCNDARYGVLRAIGAEPAEWDLIQTTRSSELARRPLPIRVYLDDLRSPFNVGSIFRTASSFLVSEILLSPATPSPTHPRAERSSMGGTGLVPWRRAELSELHVAGNVFALETGGTPLPAFRFPVTGTVIVGNEELGACPEALEIASRKAGVVTIPTGGVKSSLNVSVSFGILMHAWYSSLSSLPKGHPE